jgi:hypothetical protein
LAYLDAQARVAAEDRESERKAEQAAQEASAETTRKLQGRQDELHQKPKGLPIRAQENGGAKTMPRIVIEFRGGAWENCSSTPIVPRPEFAMSALWFFQFR